MIIVIQCAARKRLDAGHLQTGDGRNVFFVAKPTAAPSPSSYTFTRPDDPSDRQGTWREQLWAYNCDPGTNPLGLLRAIDLYANPAYARLAERFGADRTFILSAGWGLLRGDFLTPDYDITFSAMAEPYKRRGMRDLYHDFRMVPENVDGPVIFFGGKDYVPLFCKLTESLRGTRTVFYSSASAPAAPNCSVIRFPTTTKTNWHYTCVNAFLLGEITA